MKKTLLLFSAVLFAIGVYAQDKITPASPGVTYGKKINAANAIDVHALSTSFKINQVYKGKITGKVTEVCTAKGCFMRLSQEGGEGVMVRFTNYAYFMPQNIVGKTVVVEGTAKMTTTSVNDLKHDAEEAGKSEKEIAAIKTPQKDVEIMADGVLVVK